MLSSARCCCYLDASHPFSVKSLDMPAVPMWNSASTWSLRLSGRPWRMAKSALTERPLAPPPRPRGPRDHAYRSMILTSIHDIDAGRWDALVGRDNVARSHAYLAAIEGSQVHDCQYFYPVIFNLRNEIVAHACVYTITTDFAQLLPQPVQRVVRVVRRWWPRFLCARITECAAPLMVGHSLSIRDGEDQARLLCKLADAASDIAHAQHSSIVVMRDFLEPECARLDGLLAHGFRRVSNRPLARIEVRWASYDEYLASMRARYRKDIKRRLDAAAQAGQAVVTEHDFGDDADTWARQARTVHANTKGFKREAPTADYYANVAGKLADRSRMLAVTQAGRRIAHGLVLMDHTATIATFFGREPGQPGKEWFLLINEVIRLGIERRSRYIQLGLGSYDAKALVGATIEPVFIYCRSTMRMIDWLMRRVPNVFPRDLTPRKRIFREGDS
jgi:predicted N-acyltransferase